MTKNLALTKLLESLNTRYKIGGLLVGDQIRFKEDYTHSDGFQTLTPEVIELLKRLIKDERAGNIILKVAGINQAPFIQGSPQAGPCSIDIGMDIGGGRYIDVVTLPGEWVNKIERVIPDGDNLPETVPTAYKFTAINDGRPVEVTTKDLEAEDIMALPKKQPVYKMG